MSAWSKVKAAAIDTESGAVNVAPLASTAQTSRKRVGLAVQLREREKGAWSMSEVERKKQDNEGARENWTRLMSQAYDANVPVVVFQKTLNAAPKDSIDERDSNERTALMLAIQAASSDDAAALARQEAKALLLVEAGANMLLWDEDEETCISLAHAQKLDGLCFKLVNYFSNADMGVGIVWEGERFPPMVSHAEIRGALARCPTALAQTMKACVGMYARLEREQLCACAVAAFTLSRQRKDWADGLHNLICWAIEARRRAVGLKLVDSMESDDANMMGLTIELAAAGALTLLSEKGGENAWLYTKAGELLRSARGHEAFSKAVSGECKCFLSQPIVQRFIDREWHGYALDLFRPESLGRVDEEALLFRMSEGRGWPVVPCLLLVVLPLNTLLLPLVTLFPPLEDFILGSLGVRNTGCYILNVPLTKYFASIVSDWSLLLLLVYCPMDAPVWQYVAMLSWTGLCVYSETHELLTAEPTVRESVRRLSLATSLSTLVVAHKSLQLRRPGTKRPPAPSPTSLLATSPLLTCTSPSSSSFPLPRSTALSCPSSPGRGFVRHTLLPRSTGSTSPPLRWQLLPSYSASVRHTSGMAPQPLRRRLPPQATILRWRSRPWTYTTRRA